MQLDGLKSTLSPVVYGDIARSIITITFGVATKTNRPTNAPENLTSIFNGHLSLALT